MNYPKRLIDLWRASKFGAKLRDPKTRAWEMLDVWAGDTVQVDGKTFFRMPDGTLLPAIAGGGAQAWEELIDTLVADGTQVSNSTAETIVCPDFNIPAYYLAPGRTLRIYASGVCSNVVTTPGTLIFRLKMGATVLLLSPSFVLDTTARTNALWRTEMLVVCRAAGATSSFMSHGTINVTNLLVHTTTANSIVNNTLFQTLTSVLGSAGTPMASGNVAVTAVNTTIANLLGLTAQFSVATSPTNLTCQIRTIEVLN